MVLSVFLFDSYIEFFFFKHTCCIISSYKNTSAYVWAQFLYLIICFCYIVCLLIVFWLFINNILSLFLKLILLLFLFFPYFFLFSDSILVSLPLISKICFILCIYYTAKLFIWTKTFGHIGCLLSNHFYSVYIYFDAK